MVVSATMDSEETMVACTISDSGIGILAGARASIFDAFQQVRFSQDRSATPSA